ncbi:hypothetical protein K504DRAFT_458815 [Pleomassaria siparia CBS 279.74]|uniref:F-box domain-containing protein n=1 Tax=Pleomassaria siparia CBS 279.74 TaxID=1314801 RepID=A0A6G1K3Q4_9PLEO|nr:hypothetical protein K504DRAFT_458815 [Pleomassaria siparia CBS 279.74]
MERFRRTSSPPDRCGFRVGGVATATATATGTATATATATHGDGIQRKRPSIGQAAESLQSRLIASFRSVRRRGSGPELRGTSAFFAAFLRLPNELHIHILSELSISDLLSLRRSSHALNDLISSCGPPLVRYWVKHRMGTLHTQMYPPPAPNEAHLQYLLAMRRRHIASVRLTRELANFVLRDTLKHTSERQRQMWTSTYEKMIPLVFGVGYFLEEHRRVILERDLGRIQYYRVQNVGFDICTTSAITNDERAIVKRLDPPLRLQFFYMYRFIVQVLSRKLRPPTYAGSLEKFLRGWSGQAADSEDIAFVLVLGGIGQIAKLLACPNYSQRRRLLHTFITRLSPHESVGWRAHWRDVGVLSPALLDDIPCASIGITQLDQIWQPMMEDMMRPDCREFTEQQKERYHEVMLSKKFINELMGYDVLRGQQADGDDSDDEEEAEHGDDV